MHDPFPIPCPPLLADLTKPLADALDLPTLPLHIHEILFATLSYHLICVYVSPFLSSRLFPSIYPHLPPRTRLNWDVHVVSLVQSVSICSLALWVMRVDSERKTQQWEERVFGYTGAGGMIQGFAAGYFLWDLVICLRHVATFGWGLLAHAVAALIVFSLGFVSLPPHYICITGEVQESSFGAWLYNTIGGYSHEDLGLMSSSDPLSTSTAPPSSSMSSPPPS